MEVKLKLLVFSSAPLTIKKVQKVRASIYRVIAKQLLKRKQTHPVSLLAVEKYEKVESINKQNYYETTSKK